MGQKLTDRTELATTPDNADLMHVIDVSDTTDSAEGTSKKVTVANLLAGATVADASTTVKGKVELATDAEAIALTDTDRVITPSNLLAVASLLNPIGTIREFNVSTNPATLLGFGTWIAYGAGKFTIAIDSGDATMDTVDETGGAKTVTIGQTNLPNISTGAGTAHTHVQNAHGHVIRGSSGTGSGAVYVQSSDDGANTINWDTDNTTATNQNESAHTHSLGGSGTALNVMNPFIVVYRWVRTV